MQQLMAVHLLIFSPHIELQLRLFLPVKHLFTASEMLKILQERSGCV